MDDLIIDTLVLAGILAALCGGWCLAAESADEFNKERTHG